MNEKQKQHLENIISTEGRCYSTECYVCLIAKHTKGSPCTDEFALKTAKKLLSSEPSCVSIWE